MQMRRANLDDLEAVLGVLDELGSWLAQRGVKQWPRRFEAAWLLPSLEAGQTWLAEIDGRLAATITLGWRDPIWEPDDGAAGYVHRMAVRREARGLGGSLLQWADGQVLDNGRRLLRLDCVTSNLALHRYYERAGFSRLGEVEAWGGPGQREDSTDDRTQVTLYERVCRRTTLDWHGTPMRR